MFKADKTTSEITINTINTIPENTSFFIKDDVIYFMN